MNYEVLKALGNELRYDLYRYLRQEWLCVCELTELYDVSQPGISHHIRIMRETGLVESKKIQQWSFHRARTDPVKRAFEELVGSKPNAGLSDEEREKLTSVLGSDCCGIRDDHGQVPELDEE